MIGRCFVIFDICPGISIACDLYNDYGVYIGVKGSRNMLPRLLTMSVAGAIAVIYSNIKFKKYVHPFCTIATLTIHRPIIPT